MSYLENIMPLNSKDEKHGYCEIYHKNGWLCWKGVKVNGKDYGYFEEYNEDGSSCEKDIGYFLDDVKVSRYNKEGYCLVWNIRKIIGENIEPRNSSGELHGYCEQYWHHGKLMWKGIRVNGKMYCHYEGYDYDGNVHKGWTGNFFNSEKVSEDNNKDCCFIWDRVDINEND